MQPLLSVVALLTALLAGCSGAAPVDVSVGMKPDQALATMKKVADWQMANPSKHNVRGWEQSAFYAGMMALYDVSKEKTYLDTMLAMGRKNEWQLGKSIYNADDQAVGQTYCELYLIEKEPQMIAPTREQFDSILQNPKVGTFTRTAANPPGRWSWCDALFMAPPVWVRLYAATGDKRYLDFMDREWWATTELLYDPAEQLFYRDSRFITMKSKNGKKIFWARGNGWVYAGLVRVLDDLPPDHPSRPRYVKLFREMTEAIVKVQQPEGLWRPSLLDPEAVPDGETSGSGFFVYGLAWGINHGILDASEYGPKVRRGWAALVEKVHPDGKLGSVQGGGDRPAPARADQTEVFGTGAFLLAGSEVYQYLNKESASVAADSTRPATWCRFVPERKDDFAWENDLVAFRTYGPAIKSTKGTEDSGIDCWLKRVNYPIIDKWYAGEQKGAGYHRDHGEGNDPYHVGGSRGCGGLAIWKNGKMFTAGPYQTWKIISREPEKSVFELSYDYQVEGEKIHEIKRITIELGKRLFRAESTFDKDGRPVALDIAIGITTHNGKAKATFNRQQGWIACWEKIEGYGLGTGVVIAPSRVSQMRELKSSKPDESHALLLTRTDAAGKVTYYAGYGWEKARAITTPEKWQAYLTQFAATLQQTSGAGH